MSDSDIAREARAKAHRPGRPPLQIQRKTAPSKRFTGTPAPLDFDLDVLPRSARLNTADVAAACRRSIAAVKYWQMHPELFPLDWRRVAGRWLCTVGSLREFLKGTEEKRGQK